MAMPLAPVTAVAVRGLAPVTVRGTVTQETGVLRLPRSRYLPASRSTCENVPFESEVVMAV
ncbi:MAG TPA: hypothetical protein VGZ73_14380 [Bryobacteraceae bacterium]|nr:hypothetical protein [Bryobacteraceae bacterium]